MVRKYSDVYTRAADAGKTAYRMYRGGRQIYRLYDKWNKQADAARVRKRKRTSSDTQQKRPSYKRRYYTVGKLGKKTPRAKKSTPSKYLKYGTVNYIEHGGVIENSDCVYIGHSLGAHELWHIAIQAIILKLFKIAGHRVMHRDDLIPDADQLQIQWQFSQTQQGTKQTITLLLAVEDNYSDVITRVINSFEAQYELYYNSGTPPQNWAFDRIYLQEKTGSTQAELQLTDVMLDLECSSSMAIQNRTLADGVADTGNKNEVTNNPIGGRVYQGRGNGARLKFKDNSLAVANINMCADGVTGLIQMDVNSTNFTGNMRAAYKRPPPKEAFNGVSRSSMLMLSPGQIRNSRVTMKRVISFHALFKQLHLQLIQPDPTTPSKVYLGQFRFFSFEKKCNTGVGENTISIGYEINNVYRATCFQKQTISMPHVRVV